MFDSKLSYKKEDLFKAILIIVHLENRGYSKGMHMECDTSYVTCD